jgi:hypothetical protein
MYNWVVCAEKKIVEINIIKCFQSFLNDKYGIFILHNIQYTENPTFNASYNKPNIHEDRTKLLLCITEDHKSMDSVKLYNKAILNDHAIPRRKRIKHTKNIKSDYVKHRLLIKFSMYINYVLVIMCEQKVSNIIDYIINNSSYVKEEIYLIDRVGDCDEQPEHTYSNFIFLDTYTDISLIPKKAQYSVIFFEPSQMHMCATITIDDIKHYTTLLLKNTVKTHNGNLVIIRRDIEIPTKKKITDATLDDPTIILLTRFSLYKRDRYKAYADSTYIANMIKTKLDGIDDIICTIERSFINISAKT